MENKKIIFGELLIKDGLITQEQLALALEEQEKTGSLLGEALAKLHFIKEDKLARFLSNYLGIEFVELTSLKIAPEIIKIISPELARKFRVIPIEKSGNMLSVAISNPQDSFVIDELRRHLQLGIKPKIATAHNITYALEKYYGAKAELKGIISSVKRSKEAVVDLSAMAGESEVSKFGEDDAPTIKFIDQLLIDAVRDRASDIHIEPAEEVAYVRFRIDGVLKDIVAPHRNMHNSIVSRIKVICNLDIAEKRIPQDGKFERNVENAELDVRVSTFPTIYGEKIVMRILQRVSLGASVEELGLEDEDLRKFNELICKKPHGIIFVTGPTGSGKTTTLYAVLEKIKTREKNIVTIEDPVEYVLKNISQSQVNVKAGMTFSVLLRAILRQDPNIILVGETRDMETAEVAIRAALTGHLVFSTLHTNDATGAIVRLIDMGVEPFLVSTSVIGVIAQRLLRVICQKCKEKAVLHPELAMELGIADTSVIYKGRGCESCVGTGYHGRIGVFEVLMIENQMRDLIARRSSDVELKRLFRKNGVSSLRQDAIKKALKGITSVEEVLRITEKDEILI